jgi:hypothetical protein
MEKKDIFTKVLAIIGTILVWFPILMPFVGAVNAFIRAGVFHFDYLMPAELFPVALVGGGLLLWAALRTRSRRGLIAWGVGIAAGLLIGSQVLAVVTGVASGETEATAWLMALILTPLGGYALALVVIGVGGVLLMRDLFNHPAK